MRLALKQLSFQTTPMTRRSSDTSGSLASSVESSLRVEPLQFQENEREGPFNVYEDGDETGVYTSEDKKPTPSYYHKLLNRAKPEYITKHLDYASFKVVFRTWVQIWSSVIICVVPRSRTWVGPAAYLFQIIGFIAVSGGTSMVFNLAMSFMCMVYILIGWLHSIIALAISVKLRGNTSPQEYAESLIREGICTMENLEACTAADIYSGRHLQTRCTVIFIFAILSSMIIFGLSSRIHPTFRQGMICGIIAMLINVCYDVFYPVFLPLQVGLAVLKPMGLALALKVVCSMVVFPTTSNFRYVDGVLKHLKALEKACKGNSRFLSSCKPSEPNFGNYKKFARDIVGIRSKLPLLDLDALLSKYEITFGRFDAGSIGEMRSSLRNVISFSSSFEQYYQMFEERVDLANNNIRGLSRRRSSVGSSKFEDDGHSKLFATVHEHYRVVGEYEDKKRINLLRKRICNVDPQDRVTLLDIVHISELSSTLFTRFLETNTKSIADIIKWIEAANQFRIYSLLPKKWELHKEKQKEMNEVLVETRQTLLVAIKELGSTDKLIAAVKEFSKNEEVLLSLITHTCLLLYVTKQQTESILRLVDLLLSIDESTPTPKIFTFFGKSKRDKPRVRSHLNMDESPDDISTPNIDTGVQRRNPDALAPTSIFHYFGSKTIKIYKLLMNKHLWFWIRSGVLTCVCATPFFCRTTASWYHGNRLVWIVIMCGVSTSEYTGETIYVFYCKVVYSFFGCLLGMVMWYISTGNGRGNYYGYSAVTAVGYLYLTYYRHFSSHRALVPAILFAVTCSLVMGTSWVDGQYNHLANVGYGFHVAWLRFISVIIGLCVGFLASIIPKPSTSKVAIRKILAKVLSESANLHCAVSNFALNRVENSQVHLLDRHDLTVEKFRSVLIILAGISHLMTPIQFEVPLTGIWPEKLYKRLQNAVTDIIQLYFILLSIFNRVEDPATWIPHMLRRIGWTDTELCADLFAVAHMTSGSLSSKRELPKFTRANISLKHLDLLRSQWGITRFSLNERFYSEEKEKENEGDSDVLHDSLMENIDFNALFSADGQLDIVALIIGHLIYKRFDEVMLIVKQLVGEKYDMHESIFDVADDENDSLLRNSN
ncbi:hypothetical protein PGUG_00054 [Meyerozyma guilliermondii ATCC 6260]|uniref:ER transporter 6TM N-terminal domain-containing protein n=1 Tax=Meyerozyma guilliermondii (strain ATCC 6260 / CBS 566 / DSM 6381 / JCM 1539 / NBRC 10279 / NRRL Y-324) TaxID=294746 RepID=A5D9U9_PICGU|nr:uncharacterized protein PGUG_00054 [Meyerozyma guilliermondii ATCC 6260]EDK35956.2 hypothetical protein PGUG_00054 [Meyerozyma guilliermondii ATCC 6260]